MDSVDSHLPSYDDNCAAWEICGKCFLLWDRRNLIIFIFLSHPFLSTVGLIHINTNASFFSLFVKTEVRFLEEV